MCLSCRSILWCILGIVVWPYANWFCNMTSNAPTSFVRAYLRASTAEQDASRALETIEAFTRERSLIICSYYIENESGSRLDRPELFRLLRDCQQNDILLIEDVDRLSRLSGKTGIRWRKWSGRKTSGLWRWMCRRPGLIPVWVTLTIDCLQPLTICCQTGLWTTTGASETGNRESQEGR